MAEYLHGVYGRVQTEAVAGAEAAQNAFVYVGTAPVHMVSGGGENVNKPIVCRNFAQARAKLGYSDDWAHYTLCEAMQVHFLRKGVGPVIFINVMDPGKHVKKDKQTKSLAPVDGSVTIQGAEGLVLDSLAVTGKTLGTDYTVSANLDKHTVVLTEVSAGSLGAEALTITYQEADPEAVKEADVIGSTDGYGRNTGIYAIQNVYQLTGFIPSFLLCPGFGSGKAVHDALAANSRKIGGHWDGYMLTDLPIAESDGAVGLDKAAEKKQSLGFTLENETVYFPMALGTDGKRYHLSVLAAANLQALLADQDGVPYKTASNTAAEIIQNLYLGENDTDRVFPDGVINEALGKNGIASAAFVGGKWVIWGAHSADYGPGSGNSLNISEVNRMMLYYISNDFQHRNAENVDKTMTRNDIQALVAQEQARLDAMVKSGALCYGKCRLDTGAEALGDLVQGDFTIVFDVTVTPLCKSLTAVVNWTEAGISVYYQGITE